MAIEIFVDGNPSTPAPTPGTVVNAAFLNPLAEIKQTYSNTVNALKYNTAAFNATTINAAISVIGADVKSLFLQKGDWTINANVVFPDNIRLKMEPGARLVQSASYTVQLPSRFALAGGQHFSGGAGFVTFGLSRSARIQPQWWGAKGDDSTIDTFSFQEGVVATEATGGSLFVRPTSTSYVCGMVNIVNGGIRIYGENTKIKQIYDSEVGSGGAGSTKVSPVFFCKKTASNIDIAGFKFLTDDGTFPSVPGWESYLAPIIINRADYVNVHHNSFEGGQDRAIFLYGGNYAKIKENDFLDTSMIAHIGYVANTNFWDASIDNSTFYSPIALSIKDNFFIGYTKSNNCLFLSGANNFEVSGNKFLGFDSASGVPIRIYINDFGPTDVDGNPLTVMTGICDKNIIRGTFQVGIQLLGYASYSPNHRIFYKLAVKTRDNDIEGNGIGVECERVPFLTFTGNRIVTTDSPIILKREIVDSKFNKNYFECTDESIFSGSTIGISSNVTTNRVEFCDNEIVTPASDEYAFYGVAPIIFTDAKINRNLWRFRSIHASARPVQFNQSGITEFNENEFYINSSTMTGRFVAVLNKTISAWSANAGVNIGAVRIPTTPNGYQYMATTLVDTGASEPTWPTTIGATVVDNEVTWECQAIRSTCVVNGNKQIQASLRNRGIEVLAKTVYYSDNIDLHNASITGEDAIHFCGNRIVSQAGSSLNAASLEGAAFAYIAGNYLVTPFSLNSAVLNVKDVAFSKLIGNYVSGYSNGSLIRAESSGAMAYWGNTLLNAGSGGIGYGVTGAAVTNTMAQDGIGANILNTQHAAVGNVGTGEDNLMLFALLKNSLGTDGESLKIRATGKFAATANNKRLIAYFGADILFDTGTLVITAASFWSLEIEIIRTGSATQKAKAIFQCSDATVVIPPLNYTEPTRALTADNNLYFTGTGTSNNDITQEMLKILHEPI